jgi:hypothetical protein
MIRNKLQSSGETKNLHVGSLINNEKSANPITVKLLEEENCLRVNNETRGGEPLQAYFLPWKRDTGYYIDLPANSSRVVLFFTDELSGCCVGVQQLNEETVRVCHYNIRGSDFDESDFKRYNGENNIRYWLIPERYNYDASDVVKYGGYCNGRNPTLFWGEFTEGKWKFYYQTPDKVIHDFRYE